MSRPARPRATAQVAVVGAGAAGALTAARLLQHARRCRLALDVWCVDPAEATGRGVAYATSDPRHVLNVPTTSRLWRTARWRPITYIQCR